MNINVPGALATITASGTINTPIDGQPPYGMTSVTVDPSVTLATVLNTIAMLTSVAQQMQG